MEYFKRLNMEEVLGLYGSEKDAAVENIVGNISKSVDAILKTNETSKKLEELVPHLNAASLCAILSAFKLEDVFNTKTSFFVEKLVCRVKELGMEAFGSSQTPVQEFLDTVETGILVNPRKALKSKGTNHVIREVLYIRSCGRVAEAIKSMEIEYFLEDATRTATYNVYLTVADAAEKRRIVKYLAGTLTSEMLKGHLSYLYQTACRHAEIEDLDRMFDRIKEALPELASSPMGNYFVQDLVETYRVSKIFPVLRPVIHTLKTNSNVLFSLCRRACAKNMPHAVEYMIEHAYMADSLMKRLIFNEGGGFDSKTHKLALSLLSLRTKYLQRFQLECISLYEKHWLFSKIGQKIVKAVLLSGVDRDILRVFTSTMEKEIQGLRKAKGGEEMLSVLGKVGGSYLRRKIRGVSDGPL